MPEPRIKISLILDSLLLNHLLHYFLLDPPKEDIRSLIGQVMSEIVGHVLLLGSVSLKVGSWHHRFFPIVLLICDKLSYKGPPLGAGSLCPNLVSIFRSDKGSSDSILRDKKTQAWLLDLRQHSFSENYF